VDDRPESGYSLAKGFSRGGRKVVRGVGTQRAGFALIAISAVTVGVCAPGSEGSSTWRSERLAGPVAVERSTLDTRLLRAARSAKTVRVEISARRPAAVRSLVARLGGRVEMSYRGLIEAVVPSRALHALARHRAVRFAREPIRPVAESVRGEGVSATGARNWHRAGLRGAGARVAVVDLGFGGWRQSRRNGDLPQSTVAVDYCPGNFDGPTAVNHGTAVAEIVAEMAPAARLYLICVSNLAALGRAKDYARAQRIHIVNHSASWFNAGRGDDTGGLDTPTGIVAEARAAGILWVNAAGNRAQQHWSGTFFDANANGWHEFAAGDEGNTIVVGTGQQTCMALKWDSWPVTGVDYDLYLVRANDGSPVQSSITDQNGAQPPTELICHINTTGSPQLYSIAIRQSGPVLVPPRLDLFVYPGPNLEHQVAEGSVTEPGSSSSALTVGAVCWQTSGLEVFSSRGPTIDGRMKPDLTGPDWVSSFSYGPFGGCGGTTGFAGTSAATPHVAGAAALVKGLNPSFGPNELQAYLEARAIDLGVPGRDTSFGLGRVALGASPRPVLAVCTVPKLRGARLVVAKARIRRAGCRVGRVRSSRSNMRRGRVVAQRPAAGRRVSRGTRVNLTASRGRR
jgi:subtilisin family serine protease